MMPIRSPGVTVTPIKLVTGGSHFCQEFFDDVQLDPGQLIGRENDGWRVASKLLFHERNMIGGNSLNDHAASRPRRGDVDSIGELAAVAKAVGRSQDSYTRQLIGEAVILQTLGEPTISRINAQLRDGPYAGVSGLDPAADGRADELPPQGDRDGGRPAPRASCTAPRTPRAIYGQRWLAARISTVGGGSQEMQRNGISERVLGLPREADPGPGRAVQRGAGQPPPARLMKGGLMTDEARAAVPGPEGSGIDAALSPIAITAIRDFAESADLRGPVLRNLLTGDYHICLLYSEPGAGSDLAAVQTRADRDGEEWVVNRQKVWTSGAMQATHGLLVARTNWDVPKRRGITYFLLPMDQDGVEIRPIKQMTGHANFNEVFLTNARVPDSLRISALDDGWRVLQTALAVERMGMGGGLRRPSGPR